MAPIQWSSFLCDPTGTVDYKRLRALVSISLAIGGAIPLILSMLGVKIGLGDSGHMSLGAGVLISPLTAGRVTDAVLSWRRPTVANGEE